MGSEQPIITLAANDYDAILRLWEQAGLPIRPDGRDSRAEFVRQVAADTQTVLGLRDGDLLIGVILATHDGRKGWLNRLAVHPDYRRQGIAQRLIVEAESVLHDQGMQITATLIEDWNQASLELFRRAGYVDHDDIHYLTKRDSEDV